MTAPELRDDLHWCATALLGGLLDPPAFVAACESAFAAHSPLRPLVTRLAVPPPDRCAGQPESGLRVGRPPELPVEAVLVAFRATESDEPTPGEGADQPRDGGSRYERLERVGRGGLGEVWRAFDHHLRREVALKEPRPDAVDRDAAVAALRNEAATLSRLRHPNVVPLLDLVAGAAGGYTMPLLPGPSLRDAAAGFHAARPAGAAVRPRLAELLGWFLAVCHAVAHAHTQGVLHLDLKGENVKTGELGEAVVIDWGLGRPPGGGSASAGGTPGYLAPEQAGGGAIGPWTDVYGLGSVLYELLTGVPPFAGADRAAVLRGARETAPVPPRRVWSGVPRPLDAVCRKALARRPEDRYASADDLRGDVEAWLAHERVRAYAEPPLEAVARWAWRHRRAATGLTAGLLVAAAALGFGLVRSEQARATEQESLRLALRAGDDLFTGIEEEKLLLPDGAMKFRRRLVDRGREYFQNLIDRYPNNSAVRAEYASAWLRIGEFHHETGRHADALAAYDRAAEAGGREADFETRLRLARARTLVVVGGPGELGAELDAVDALLRAASPDDPTTLHRRGLVLHFRSTGGTDPAAAADAAKQAGELFDRAAAARGAGVESNYMAAVARLHAAANLRSLRRFDEARGAAADGLRRCRRLIEEHGPGVELRARAAACLNMQGLIEFDRGEFPAALALYDQAAEVRRELHSRNPGHGTMPLELATSLANQGRARLRMGLAEGACRSLGEACELAEAMLADQGTAHARRSAAVFHRWAADAEMNHGCGLSVGWWAEAGAAWLRATAHTARAAALSAPPSG